MIDEWAWFESVVEDDFNQLMERLDGDEFVWRQYA